MQSAAGYLGQYERSDSLIDCDRECLDCGYNLRGLRTGGKCPECGALITRPSSGDDPLSRMPWRVIRDFRRASWLAAFVITAVPVAMTLAAVDWLPAEALQYVGAVVLPLWLLSMLLLTPAIPLPEAVSRGFTKRSRVRLIARWGQLGWLLVVSGMVIQPKVIFACGLGMPRIWGSAAVDVLAALLVVFGALIGAVGMLAMAVMMERLAEWTRDSIAERFFQWFQWGVGLFVLVWIFPVYVPVLTMIASAFALVAVFFFPLGILLLARSISMSAVHWREDRVRDKRREVRRAREQAELTARVAAIDRAAAARSPSSVVRAPRTSRGAPS